MAWVKLDDQFARHPKVLRAGPLASWLHVCALTYCAQYATDGFVPHVAVNGLADFSGIKMSPFKSHRGRVTNNPEGLDFVGELIAVGMWEEVEDGYRLHDYLDYNPSREQVEKERIEARARMNKARSSPELPPNNPNGSAEPHGRARPVPGPSPAPTPERPETAPSGAARAAVPRPKREHLPVNDEFIETLAAEYGPKMGGAGVVREEVEAALNHTASKKCIDQRMYLRTWLNRDVRRGPIKANLRPMRPVDAPPEVPADSPFLKFRGVG